MTRSEYWGAQRKYPRGGTLARQVHVWRSRGETGTTAAQPLLYYVGRPGGARLWVWSSTGSGGNAFQTLRTVYHRYEVRLGSPVGGKAYVWQNAGSSAAAATAATRRIGILVRRRHDPPMVMLA